MKLLVSPLEHVPALCETHRPSHLVTWLSPPAVAPDLPADLAPGQRLVLTSHDICAPQEGLVQPSREHVAELLAFTDAWTGELPMLVHCWAGVSRSTAAAFVMACRKRPDLPEIALARQLRALSPEATPNALIVQLADRLMGRGGRMSGAVAAIGRGAETSCGRPFVFSLL
jgi:predicted protein tyrosine phosphatase